MDLNTLASDLRAQAAKNSTIVLNSSVFADDAVRTRIRSAFALESGKDLIISGVTPADIPDPTADGVLTISTGVASVLKQTDAGVTLAFTSNGSDLEVIIVADMGDSWDLNKSFDGLDKFPFNVLQISKARFVYTTVAQSSYAWPGEQSYKVRLDPGLNLLSHVTFKHLPKLQTLLSSVIGNWSLARKFYGPFSPTVRTRLAGRETPRSAGG